MTAIIASYKDGYYHLTADTCVSMTGYVSTWTKVFSTQYAAVAISGSAGICTRVATRALAAHDGSDIEALLADLQKRAGIYHDSKTEVYLTVIHATGIYAISTSDTRAYGDITFTAGSGADAVLVALTAASRLGKFKTELERHAFAMKQAARWEPSVNAKVDQVSIKAGDAV